MNHLPMLLLLFFIVCCASCESIQHQHHTKKSASSIETKKVTGIFNKNKCWWVRDYRGSDDDIHKNSKTFKRCVIAVKKDQFPEHNQLYLPDDSLIKKLKKECKIQDSFYVLVDYFWSKEVEPSGRIDSGTEKHSLHGLFLRKQKK